MARPMLASGTETSRSAQGHDDAGSEEAPSPPQEKKRKPRRGELQDRVVEQMRRALMVGMFVPGQMMSLRQLAKALGTSSMPVREAIKQLTAAGVLETLPNRSVAVPRMTRARFIELTRVRKALEGMAAQMACENVTPDLVVKLNRINGDLHRAIRHRDILGCLSKNKEFHFTLYAASRSAILPGFIEALWLRAGPFMYFSLLAPSMPWDASAHRDVLEALRRGNPSATRQAIERDIACTARYLLTRSSAFQSDSGPMAALRGV